MSLHVDIVSAEESIFSGEVKFIGLPGESGELGILPRHTPLMTRIKSGAVHLVMEDGGEEYVHVHGGVLEVQPNGVTVLADTAIRGKDLDEAKVQEALKSAEEARKNAASKQDIAVVEGEIAMLSAQLSSIRKLRKRG